MQDRYAGDIGDFGKFSFLKALETQGLKIGINWYLTEAVDPAEQKRMDGRHCIDSAYRVCDPVLFEVLTAISNNEEDRSVASLEEAGLLNTAVYFHERVPGKEERAQWHERALQALAGADVLFLDPDNGLQVKSVGPGSRKSVKYVLDAELKADLKTGRLIVFYQHRPREKADVYFPKMQRRIRGLSENPPLHLRIHALTFPKGTRRDYFVLCQKKEQEDQALAAMKSLLDSEWGEKGLVVVSPL